MRTLTLMAALAVPTSFLILGCTGFYSGDGDEEVRTQRRTATAYARFDADGDGALARHEFAAWWTEEGPFAIWDQDNDEEISDTELAFGLSDTWDANDDGELSEEEWRTGVAWLGDEPDRDAWNEWDSNGDGELDAREIGEGVERHGLHDSMDTDDDDVINDGDLRAWFFDAIDADGDDEIDAEEWDGFEI